MEEWFPFAVIVTTYSGNVTVTRRMIKIWSAAVGIGRLNGRMILHRSASLRVTRPLVRYSPRTRRVRGHPSTNVRIQIDSITSIIVLHSFFVNKLIPFPWLFPGSRRRLVHSIEDESILVNNSSRRRLKVKKKMWKTFFTKWKRITGSTLSRGNGSTSRRCKKRYFSTSYCLHFIFRQLHDVGMTFI